MVWLHCFLIPVRRRGVFSSFKWFLTAVTTRTWREEGVGTLCSIHNGVGSLFIADLSLTVLCKYNIHLLFPQRNVIPRNGRFLPHCPIQVYVLYSVQYTWGVTKTEANLFTSRTLPSPPLSRYHWRITTCTPSLFFVSCFPWGLFCWRRSFLLIIMKWTLGMNLLDYSSLI